MSTVEQYDPATDSWSTRHSLPTARRYLAVSATSDGDIYAIGGDIQSGAGELTVGTVEVYNPSSDSWSSKASMPTARSMLSAAQAQDGKIYAVGGITGANGLPLATVEQYDPVNDSWTTRSSLPMAEFGSALVAMSDGNLYLMGGESNGDGSGSLNAVYAYNPLSDTWITVPPLPAASGMLAAAVATNGKVYAVAGYNNLTLLGYNQQGSLSGC
jgi:N-acetylneuraminic acid mutarotase